MVVGQTRGSGAGRSARRRFPFRPVNVKAKSVLFYKVPELRGQATVMLPSMVAEAADVAIDHMANPACTFQSTLKQSWRLCLQQRNT